MVKKYFKITLSTSSCFSYQTPFESHNPSILFFLRLWLAIAWKNFVFRSPHLIHRAHDFLVPHHLLPDRALHRFSFLELGSPQLFCGASLEIPVVIVDFAFVLGLCSRFQNTLRFQFWRWTWQLFNLSCIRNSRFPFKGSQVVSISSLHLSSLVHIASKKNLFFTGFDGKLFLRKMVNRQWPNADIDMWWT